MGSPSQVSERFALVGTIDPQTVANSIVYTDVIDMSKFSQVYAACLLGNMAAETIDFKLYSCNSDGSSPVAIRSATQLAAHASNNDNVQVIIEARGDELGSGVRYVKFGLVTGNTTGGPAAVAAFGVRNRYAPGTDNDLASIAEIKAA